MTVAPGGEKDPKSFVRVDRTDADGGGWIARVTLCHAERINLVNTPILRELVAVFRELALAGDLRLAVLTGDGDRSFIGGADINEMAKLTPATAREFITLLHDFCGSIRALPVPVIARIRGYCIGGGTEVAAACDLRVASDDSVFGMPEVRVGIPSVIEAALLPRLMGWGKAREMIYTGDRMTAAEARECGLIEKVVPADRLDAAVDAWIASILQCGPEAIRTQKILFREWERFPPEEAMAMSVHHFGRAFEGEEPRRMMRAFLDRPRGPRA